TDVELLHDVVGGERPGGDDQASMELCHRAVDPPCGPDGAPLGNESLSGFSELVAVTTAHAVIGSCPRGRAAPACRSAHAPRRYLRSGPTGFVRARLLVGTEDLGQTLGRLRSQEARQAEPVGGDQGAEPANE